MWRDFWDTFIYFPDDPFKSNSLQVDFYLNSTRSFVWLQKKKLSFQQKLQMKTSWPLGITTNTKKSNTRDFELWDLLSKQACIICRILGSWIPGTFFPRHFYTIYAIFTQFYAILHDFCAIFHDFCTILREFCDFYAIFCDFYAIFAIFTRFLRFLRDFLPGKNFSIPGTKNYYPGLARVSGKSSIKTWQSTTSWNKGRWPSRGLVARDRTLWMGRMGGGAIAWLAENSGNGV